MHSYNQCTNSGCHENGIQSMIMRSFTHFVQKNINTTVHLVTVVKVKYVCTAVCRIIKGLPFYSTKRPILRVVGGSEGVVPHPHMVSSK